MTSSTIHTGDDSKDFILSMAKKYQIEDYFKKNNNKMFIFKEGEYTKVRRIIHKFELNSYAEFDTIFKLYKLQKYCIDINYFKGSQYKYQTLLNMKSMIKSACIDCTIRGNNAMSNLINEFVGCIQDFSKPFSGNLVDAKRKTIKDLLNSGITKEDKDFILSDIKSRYVRKRLNKSKQEIQEATDMQVQNTDNLIVEQPILTGEVSSQDKYRLIVKYYKQPKAYKLLRRLMPDVNHKSISSYISYLNRFDEGKLLQKGHCPTGLYKEWLKANNKEHLYDTNCKYTNTTQNVNLHDNIISSNKNTDEQIECNNTEVCRVEPQNNHKQQGAIQSNDYILVKDDTLVAKSCSLEFLRQYIQASICSDNFKIYSLVQ